MKKTVKVIFLTIYFIAVLTACFILDGVVFNSPWAMFAHTCLNVLWPIPILLEIVKEESK